MGLLIEVSEGDAVVLVHVQPRAGRTGVAGLHAEALRIRVQAPPVDGRATEAARAVLAAAVGIPASRVTLVTGERSRLKRFRLGGIAATVARDRLEAVLASRG